MIEHQGIVDPICTSQRIISINLPGSLTDKIEDLIMDYENGCLDNLKPTVITLQCEVRPEDRLIVESLSPGELEVTLESDNTVVLNDDSVLELIAFLQTSLDNNNE